MSLVSRLSSLPQAKSAVIWRVFNFSLNDHKKKSNMYIYTYLERPFLILRIDEMSRKVKMKTGISRWGPGLETYEFGDLENSTTNLSEAQDILEIPWMTRRKMTRNWAFSRVRNIHTCICICTHVFVMGMFLGRTFRSSPRTRFHL